MYVMCFSVVQLTNAFRQILLSIKLFLKFDVSILNIKLNFLKIFLSPAYIFVLLFLRKLKKIQYHMILLSNRPSI